MSNTGSILSGLTSSMSSKGALVVFGVITFLLIILVVCYIAYRVRRKDLRSVSIVKSPRRLYEMTSPLFFDSDKLPSTLNGQEYSFSSWLYITDFVTTTDYKLIMMRGGNGTSIASATPIMFMDNKTNKLYISIKTNQSSSVSRLSDVLDKSISKYLTATVEYLPLQRWVQVAFVVQDNLLSVYLDGDMYTVENVYDFNVPGTSRPVFAGTSGNAIVGNVPGTASTQGFICKTEFFNYGLSQNDIRAIHDVGPVSSKNVLARMGLPAYGVRSPIYREDEIEENEDHK